MDEMKILAIKAKNYDIKAGQGGRRSNGESSCYGIALKYLISTRRISLNRFAKACDMSPQAFNFVVNHSEKKNFSDAEITLYAKTLGIDKQFLINLAEEIDKLM